MGGRRLRRGILGLCRENLLKQETGPGDRQGHCPLFHLNLQQPLFQLADTVSRGPASRDFSIALESKPRGDREGAPENPHVHSDWDGMGDIRKEWVQGEGKGGGMGRGSRVTILS